MKIYLKLIGVIILPIIGFIIFGLIGSIVVPLKLLLSSKSESPNEGDKI